MDLGGSVSRQAEWAGFTVTNIHRALPGLNCCYDSSTPSSIAGLDVGDGYTNQEESTNTSYKPGSRFTSGVDGGNLENRSQWWSLNTQS